MYSIDIERAKSLPSCRIGEDCTNVSVEFYNASMPFDALSTCVETCRSLSLSWRLREVRRASRVKERVGQVWYAG
jgi:hypothetical protein